MAKIYNPPYKREYIRCPHMEKRGAEFAGYDELAITLIDTPPEAGGSKDRHLAVLLLCPQCKRIVEGDILRRLMLEGMGRRGYGT